MTDQNYSGDYFLKLLRNVYIRTGTTLPASDFSTLQRLVDSERDVYEQIRSWISLATVDFRNIRVSNDSFFSKTPIEMFALQRVGAQTIPNNTETPIQFNAVSPNTETFQISSSVSTKIMAVNRSIGIIGKLEWAANANGRRGCHLNWYDSSDALITGTTLHSFPGSDIAENTYPVAGGVFLPKHGGGQGYPNISHVKVTVVQTSGGDLNLNVAHLFLFRLS